MTKTTVLIVEDEAIVAADLAGKLGQLGYQVVGTAAEGKEAVEMACRLQPRVVLMDFRLKGTMDGIEAAEGIRASIDLPVIFLTAHSDAATLERVKQSDPFGYILKPFEERELATTIEMALYKHQSDRQLREQREWLRVTLTSIGDAVITCNTEGRVNFLNPVAEALTGWKIEEARYRPIGEVFHLIDEQTGQPSEDPLDLVLQEGRTKTLANHTALVARDGRRVLIEDSASPILDAAGRVIGAVLVFHDVTEKRRSQVTLRASRIAALNLMEDAVAARKLAEETSAELLLAKDAAESANRAKSQFLANMSHELRTPMGGVLGMLELALTGPLEEQQREYVETAIKSGRSLLRILNDILDQTRIESGKLYIEEHPFSLAECVSNAVELLSFEARRKGLSLTHALAEEVPRAVIGDQLRLRQVLVNLIGNAVKFTEQGGIEVRVAAGDTTPAGTRSVTFTVSDSGIGIAADRQGILFASFSQADDSNTRKFGGTGLGLTISKEIVELMGGTISVASENGMGSTFTVTIAFAEAEPETVVEPSAPQETPARAEAAPAGDAEYAPRLLIAEDDSYNRLIFTRILKMHNIESDAATNGLEAVEMWEQGNYDLIIMDVQMPRMDGFEATRTIRDKERQRGGHTPILAMTAHASREDEQRCFDAGMDAFLSKPVDLAKAIEVVRELVGNNRNLPA